MKYSNIVFLQDSEADEVLNILDEYGAQKAFEYLLQWDYGEHVIEEQKIDFYGRDFTPWGKNDRLFKKDNYVMTYNLSMGYIGLTKIFKW